MLATLPRRRRSGAEVGRLLLACTREHDWERPLEPRTPALSRQDQRLLARRASLHGIEACVHLTLRFEEWLDDAIRQELQERYHTALQVHLRAVHDLGIAGTALDRAGVGWAAFKGPVLAEHTYRRPDLRSYSDLDLLVAPGELHAAVEALEGCGGTLLDRNWRLVRERMSGELHVLLPTGTVADLHWSLFNREETRRAFPVRTADVLSRAVVVALDATPVRTLGDEDALVHLAVHACLAGGSQLLWCKDLEQAVIHRRVDWDAVVGRAHEWRAGPPTALMIGTASRALDFPVPDDVLRQLSPGLLWRGLTTLIDRWSPVERWSGGGSIRRDLSIASRGDDLAGAAALARRAGSLIKKRARGGPVQPNRDPAHPSSLLHPSADPDDQAMYFRAVESAEPRDQP